MLGKGTPNRFQFHRVSLHGLTYLDESHGLTYLVRIHIKRLHDFHRVTSLYYHAPQRSTKHMSGSMSFKSTSITGRGGRTSSFHGCKRGDTRPKQKRSCLDGTSLCITERLSSTSSRESEGGHIVSSSLLMLSGAIRVCSLMKSRRSEA